MSSQDEHLTEEQLDEYEDSENTQRMKMLKIKTDQCCNTICPKHLFERSDAVSRPRGSTRLLSAMGYSNRLSYQAHMNPFCPCILGCPRSHIQSILMLTWWQSFELLWLQLWQLQCTLSWNENTDAEKLSLVMHAAVSLTVGYRPNITPQFQSFHWFLISYAFKF